MQYIVEIVGEIRIIEMGVGVDQLSIEVLSVECSQASFFNSQLTTINSGLTILYRARQVSPPPNTINKNVITR